MSNERKEGVAVVDKLMSLLQKKAGPQNSILKWMQLGNSVCLQTVTNDLAGNLQDELKLRLIPFSSMKKNGFTLFCIRDVDEKAFDLCLATVRFRLSKETVIYTYNELNSLVAEEGNNKKISYLTGLSELEMEYLRRDISQKGGGKHFSITRMEDNTWMMGFHSEDMLELNPKSRRCVPIVESIIKMVLDLNGKYSLEIKKRLKNNITADRRMSMINLKERLTTRKQHLYFYDPKKPKKTIYLAKDYWCILETKNLRARDIRFIPHKKILYEEIGSFERLRSEVAQMQNKAICNDETTLYRAVLDYQHRDVKEDARVQNYLDANRECAKTLYDAFALRHETDKEFQEKDIKTQVFVCLTESQILLNSYCNHEVIDPNITKRLDSITSRFIMTSIDLIDVIAHFKLEPIIEREAEVPSLSLMQRIGIEEQEVREEQDLMQSLVIE